MLSQSSQADSSTLHTDIGMVKLLELLDPNIRFFLRVIIGEFDDHLEGNGVEGCIDLNIGRDTYVVIQMSHWV